MQLQKNIFFILIIIINTHITFCQDKKMENKIAEVKKTGKQTILKTANYILNKKYTNLKIDLKDYEITVWANKENILVNYKKLLKFTPLGYKRGHFDYDFSVNIITKEIPSFDMFGTSKFYIPTKQDIKKINFVKKVIDVKPRFNNEVFEEHDKYIISISNDTYFIIYHIDKITGKEIPQSFVQGNWEPSPFQEKNIDPLIEIIK